MTKIHCRLPVNHDVVSSSLTGAAKQKRYAFAYLFCFSLGMFKLQLIVCHLSAVPTEREVGSGRARPPPVVEKRSAIACVVVKSYSGEQSRS